MFNTITNIKKMLQNAERETIIFIMLLLFLSIFATALLWFYFSSYSRPYMLTSLTDISEEWLYSVNGSEPVDMLTLRSGHKLKAGEALTLYRTLNDEMKNAAII